MKKLKSTPINMILSLGVITGMSAALLAWSYNTTALPIATTEAKAKDMAIADVLPAFDNSPGDNAVSITLNDGSPLPLTLYPATDGGTPVGAAVETYSPDGFSGMITLLIGFDTKGHITGYRVLSHAETPGLGSKMDEWFRSPRGRRNIIGTDMSASAPLSVTKDGGTVDAITAATISSRAFTDAVNRAWNAYSQYTASN